MKVILITLLLVGTAFSAVVQQTRGSGPACPIDDPLEIEAGNINTTAITPIFELDVGSYQNGAVATGLTTLYYEYTINLLTLSLTFNAGLSASIKGDEYSATGFIDASPFSANVVPSGPLAGAGSFEGSIAGGVAEGSATVFVNLITGKVTLSKLAITKLVFDSISANIGGLEIDGVAIDFAAWNASIKENFDTEFAAVGADFVERVRTQVINVLLKEYSLADFLDLIGEGSTPAPCDEQKH